MQDSSDLGLMKESQLRPKASLFDPTRWGLSAEAIASLGDSLYKLWGRFRHCFKTRTRDTSQRALDYLRGQLAMDDKRTFLNIDRHLNGGDGQGMQHFMSNSAWSGQSVFRQIRQDVVSLELPFKGSTLIMDETADEKAGTNSAGASRQYNGRLGKVDLCRVDTFLSYYHAQARLWTIVDGELFLPKEWFGESFAQKREKLGIPKGRVFETKGQQGMKMIKRVKAEEFPFELVACDSLYGRDAQFRAALEADRLEYAAQVPSDTRVYLKRPVVGMPQKKGKKGRHPKRLRVLSEDKAQEVRELAKSSETVWDKVNVRHTERGILEEDFAVMRVWTLTEDRRLREEWLVIRREDSGDCSYFLLNSPPDTPKADLIEKSCRRYFIERTIEDAKMQLGWDDFCAQKYRAWEHHLALTGLAMWFVALTKWDWSQRYGRDTELMHQLELEVLPALSTANVRELLKASMPLPRLTPEQAMQLVATHLVNRARSTSSRLKSRGKSYDDSS